MKELLHSILALIGALIVCVLLYPTGIIYSLCYAIWLSFTMKKWYAFFLFWWRLIDGFCASIGHIIYNIAFGLDLGWNVNGEMIEDGITAEEHTTFSQKNITVSASVGKLEVEGKLNKAGKIVSKILSIAFGQKQHAVDAWNFTQARKKLEDTYFKSLKTN